jgi:hypothetical protein
MTPRAYGWKPDSVDSRDLLFADVHHPHIAELPERVSLRDRMPPVFDQGQLGSCHDDETEVLTENGWKLFAEVEAGERLATVDPKTAELSYEKPARLIRFPYVGEMVCGENTSINFRVTPNHKMLVRKWDEAARTLAEDYSFVPAKDIGWYAGLMSRVVWKGEGASDQFIIPGVAHKHKPQRQDRAVPMDMWLRFLGLFVAEGTLIKPWQERRHYKIQIAAFKDREKTFAREVFAALGLRALELADRFTIDNRQIYDCLAGLGFLGTRAPQKRVPTFVFQQAAHQIKEFLLGHFMGDGAEQHGSKSHYTSSEGLANDLQRLVFLSGDEAGIYVREIRPAAMLADGRTITGRHPERRVSVRGRKNLSVERKRSISRSRYAGEVFCAEVPTHHTLVTRREGKILVSGNCTANAILGAFGFLHPGFIGSRLALYYAERLMEGTVDQDAGAMIRDGVKVLASQGVPPESEWPYDIARFREAPPARVMADAGAHKVISYSRLTTGDDMRQCLADGFPFIIGAEIWPEFESAAVAHTGCVPLPNFDEDPLGGHAFDGVGFDRHSPVGDGILCRNSWNDDWALGGYFWIPAGYLSHPELASDCWTLRA